MIVTNKNGIDPAQKGEIAKVSDQQVAETVTKKKRGLKTFSAEANTTARPAEIADAISSAFQYFKMPLVKSDEECAERLNAYFEECKRQGRLPKVETMALALGTVRQVVWKWENGNGCSQVRQRMIQRAKAILAAVDAELVSSGKLPQVVYIFRAKNFYDMKDQNDVVITPNNPLGQEESAETIAEKYAELPGAESI